MTIPRIKDTQWTRQSFLLPEEAIDAQDMVRRVLTTASYKFTDTTLGGNFAINAPPQFTRFADIKVGGNSDVIFQRASGTFLGKDRQKASNESRLSASRGMGRYYSEAIDDNGQHVVMRFGVPEFNSLTKFFGGFYDPAMSALARTGRGPSLLYSAGKAAGFLLALPFMPFVLGGQIINFFAESPSTKYYYLKPAMPLYWSAVNAMVNGIAVNLGLVPRVLTPTQEKVYNNPQKFGPDTYRLYNQWLPDIIGPTGAIDVYAIATRAQRLAHDTNKKLRERLENAINAEQTRQVLAQWQVEPAPNVPPSQGVDKYVAAYANIASNRPPKDAKEMDSVEAADDRSRYDGAPSGGVGNWGSSFAEFFEGERRDGAQFVTFRVDFSGAASESFSNSTKESEIAQKINSMSSQARSTRFNFANGNIGDGVFASAIEGIGNAVKDVAAGIMDGLQIEGLMALGGSAFVDIPKMWDQSSANLPRMDYSIELRSPYGNKLSRLQNLYVPLCMLLAGALPISTGARSYTSPFLVEAYCRGRAAIRMGMIDSISITRGTGNMGWTQDGEPLGIDVSFSIVDLSTVLHMPIAPAFKLSTMVGSAAQAVGGDKAAEAVAALSGSTYEEDTPYNDYLGVLGSLSFQDMVYVSNKWRLNLTKQLRTYESWRSPAHATSWFFGTFPGRVLSAIALGTDRNQ